MDEILGVQALDFENSNDVELVNLGQNLSPKSSLKQLQQQSEVRYQFSEWMTTIKSKQLATGSTTPVL